MSAHDVGQLNPRINSFLQSLSPFSRIPRRGRTAYSPLSHRFRFRALTLIPGMIAAVLSLASPAHAQSTGSWANERELFAKVCSRCHETGIGPVLTGRNLAPDYYKRKVRFGLRAMPAFRNTEIDDALLEKLAQMLSATPASGK